MGGKPAPADDQDDGSAIRVFSGREHVHGQGHAEFAAVDYIFGSLVAFLPGPGAGHEQEKTTEENCEECSHDKSHLDWLFLERSDMWIMRTQSFPGTKGFCLSFRARSTIANPQTSAILDHPFLGRGVSSFAEDDFSLAGGWAPRSSG